MPTDEEILKTGAEEAQAAAEQGTSTEEVLPLAAVETPTPPTAAEKGQLAALEDERTKRQAAEAQLAQYQQLVMQQQAMYQAVARPSVAQPTEALDQVGIEPTDLYTEDGLRKFVASTVKLARQEAAQEVARIRQELNQQQFNQQHTDYSDLVGTPGPMGFQPAPPLQRALKDNPGLQQDLLAITDPTAQARAAYRYAAMAKQVMDLEARLGAPNPKDIETQVAASTAVMSPAAAGAGGAFTTARAYGDLSDEEFAKLDREAAAS